MSLKQDQPASVPSSASPAKRPAQTARNTRTEKTHTSSAPQKRKPETAPASGNNKKKPPSPPDQPAPTPPKKKKKPLNIRAILTAMLVLLIFVITLSALLIYTTAGNNSLAVRVPQLGSRPYFSWNTAGDEADNTELRDAVLFYVSHMNYSPQNILKFLNGSEAVPVFFHLEQERLYCAIPRNLFRGVEDFDIVTRHPEYIERAERLDDRLVLGTYQLKDVNAVLFSFPIEDLRIETNAILEVEYPSATYRLSLTELVQFHYNRNMYGTFYLNQCRNDPERLRGQALQLPAFVVYPGEPSVASLALQLTGDEFSIEKRTQRFLDFVTREIRPDADLVKSCDQIKKVNEVLMTGSCGLQETVILYASLLEQTEIDYLIVYTDGQAAVLVEGDYPLQRGALVMHINGKAYHLADPNQRGFVIGQPAGPDWQADRIRYIQRAGINSTTYSVETGLPN